ncbi:hypothetical protein BV898_14415 [Hypsibius exemplaris]|uniref:39S ribosomal protein L35, mitochondrial n=1 Tax=Hypsibius exemplaris TaxID=2072580 RepID=A0A9X6RJH1_HYPEX|nr:hypothetical protein BV898_14415 [Hypsibius exemplaris]
MWRATLGRIAGGLLPGLRAAPANCKPSTPHLVTQLAINPAVSAILPANISAAPFSTLLSRGGGSSILLQRLAINRMEPAAGTPTPTAASVIVPQRNFTKMRMSDGKKVSDPFVLQRFYRLAWGGWIKRIAGCNKRVWQKSRRERRRREQHVFVSGHFCKMFDHMVTRDYRREKYYVDDIYEPYHRRNNLTHPYFVPQQERLYTKMTFPELSATALAARKTLDNAFQALLAIVVVIHFDCINSNAFRLIQIVAVVISIALNLRLGDFFTTGVVKYLSAQLLILPDLSLMGGILGGNVRSSCCAADWVFNARTDSKA